VPTGTLQVPSNVTRIGRALKRVGLDGAPQIIYVSGRRPRHVSILTSADSLLIQYHSGVGTGSGMLDAIGGGVLGVGISEVSCVSFLKFINDF
jgi:hypothetical protein